VGKIRTSVCFLLSIICARAIAAEGAAPDFSIFDKPGCNLAVRKALEELVATTDLPKLSDLKPGDFVYHEDFGKIKIVEVKFEQEAIRFVRLGENESPILVAGQGRKRFAYFNTIQQRALARWNLERKIRTENIAVMFAIDGLADRIGVNRVGAVDASHPSYSVFEKVFHELWPRKDFGETFFRWVNDFRYVRSTSETSLSEANEFVKAASQRTGEDFVRTGVLNAVDREKRGVAWYPTLSKNRSMQHFPFIISAKNSPTGAKVVALSREEKDFIYRMAWDHSKEFLAVEGKDSELTVRAIGKYIHSENEQHESDWLTQKIIELKKEPSRARAKEIIERNAEKVDALLRWKQIDLIVPLPTATAPSGSMSAPVAFAKELGGRYTKIVEESVLGWTSNSPRIPQKSQAGFIERIGNVSHAMKFSIPLKGKEVVLVDDVATTGASLEEARRAAMEAGAKKVYVVTIGQVEKLNP
jgi:phosphoribosylpyrophosphate synthetase